MLTNQRTLDALTARIERAYRLRRPEWHGGCSSSRVWSAATTRLLEASEAEPSLPVDPELYVASQPMGETYADPWSELAGLQSVRRFRERVAGIVGRLHEELVEEVRVAERRVEAGRPISRVLTSKSGRLSALGRYAVAVRAGRVRLACRFVEGAVLQHQSCPLYRQACSVLFPPAVYPVLPGQEPRTSPTAKVGNQALIMANLN